MILRYAIFGFDTFTKSTAMVRYFYKKYRRKSIVMQKFPTMGLSEYNIQSIKKYRHSDFFMCILIFFIYNAFGLLFYANIVQFLFYSYIIKKCINKYVLNLRKLRYIFSN